MGPKSGNDKYVRIAYRSVYEASAQVELLAPVRVLSDRWVLQTKGLPLVCV